MTEVKKTITTIFMVPTLRIPRDKLLENEFVNAFIKDSRKEIQYDGCIYLLFKPKDLDNFKDFLDEEYMRTKSVVDDYDYENGYVVVVYELNKKFKKDFELIKLGKYSKTSLEFQEMFPKIIKMMKGHLHRDEISLQYRVFNRTEDMIQYWEDKLGVVFGNEQEVWHGFEEEQEILDINNIKEYV